MGTPSRWAKRSRRSQDWHDLYAEALSPVQKAAIKIGDLLFTPLSALLHTVWFALWFLLKLDINLLTLIVSLEAIYITLFIGLGQKLADKRSAIHADHDRHEAQQSEAHREKLAETQQQLLVENTRLTEQIVTSPKPYTAPSATQITGRGPP